MNSEIAELQIPRLPVYQIIEKSGKALYLRGWLVICSQCWGIRAVQVTGYSNLRSGLGTQLLDQVRPRLYA